ncbi:unnamed protein product [Pylaiella littoralis]
MTGVHLFVSGGHEEVHEPGRWLRAVPMILGDEICVGGQHPVAGVARRGSVSGEVIYDVPSYRVTLRLGICRVILVQQSLLVSTIIILVFVVVIGGTAILAFLVFSLFLLFRSR